MKHTHRIYTRLGFLICALAIIFGAFGTHFLRDFIGSEEIITFDTGVKYQMYHGLAIIILAIAHRRFNEKKLDLALSLFIGGIIIFSGSLYLLATRNIWGDDSYAILGAITPIGGICLIGGWLVLFFKGFDPLKNEVVSNKSSSSKIRKRRRAKSSDSDSKND